MAVSAPIHPAGPGNRREGVAPDDGRRSADRPVGLCAPAARLVHRVVAAGMKGMAPGDPEEGLQGSPHHPVLQDGEAGIRGACGVKSAGGGEKRRYSNSIEIDQGNGDDAQPTDGVLYRKGLHPVPRAPPGDRGPQRLSWLQRPGRPLEGGGSCSVGKTPGRAV